MTTLLKDLLSAAGEYSAAGKSSHSAVHSGVDRAEIASVMQENRDRLLRLISLRLDSRLNGRIDPSDILQETFLRASAAFDDYCRQSQMPLYNWLRLQARFAVGDCHRRHLATQKRAVRNECVKIHDSRVIALEQLAESMISPQSRLAMMDLAEQVKSVIAGMQEHDREILVLRHIEDLSISEAAAELNINVATAKKRHLRAIRRLQELCEDLNSSQAE